MDQNLKKELQILACNARMGIINGVHSAKSGHPGGSLSCVDTLTYLYHCVMRHDPKNPKWADRDRLVLSKGHCAPALYAVLANEGYFDKEMLTTLRHVGSFLQGHPEMKKTPGIDMSTGSLGQGISAACGMAMAAKLSNKDTRIFAVMGDGEIEEGMAWEAFMFASHYKLNNLTVVIDYNGLQIDGRLSEVCSPEPIPQKLEAFGFNTIVIDGHNFDEIEAAFENAKTSDKPTAIIQKTVKGKGVSFMEDNVSWHGSAPNDEQYAVAMEELNAALAELEGQA